jgi:chemotaxis protein CheD
VSTIFVGVGEIGVARQPGEVLKTMALGSCVAVVLLDKATRIIGMDHVALPESSISPERARERPGYFADTGIPALLAAMAKVGARRESIIVKLMGGAAVLDPNNTFNIGKRNALAIKKILWSQRMGAVAEDLGGTISRTVAVDVDKGRVVLSSPGKPDWEI